MSVEGCIWTERGLLLHSKESEGAYHATKSHPSVVGYAIARGSTNGIVIYELYLRMKSLETSLPIVYEGYGGEWCSDRISFR